jgi:hypothetical protein
MKTQHFHRNARFVLMSVTVVAIAAFGIFGAGWATPARADGGSGTVPGVPGNNSSGSGVATAAAATTGGCGLGAQTFSVTGATNVTQLLDVSIGTVMLLSNQGGVGTGAIRPLFVPITSLRVNLIGATLLQSSPAG